jgi:RHS repeat-associated protein
VGYNLGDVVSIADPLGRTTTRFLDAAGRILALTNPLGQTTRYTYDALNAVASVTDSIGGQTSFTYDGNGNLLTLTDARSNTTTYTYNSMDRVATRTDPLTRQESYTYDNDGNLSQVTDRKSQTTSYAYDPLDRPTTITYHDSSTTAYTHDAGDRLTQVVDSIAGTITRAYDLLDRLTSETVPEGSVSHTYDAADRRTTMTVAGQTQVTYGYDSADRLTSIAQGSANVGFTYDSADRRTVLTLPNGVTVESSYDAASQLTGLTYKLGSNTLGDLTYTYDMAGNRLTTGGSWARTGVPAALASATYDAANQISTWASTSFTYDANGNLTNDGSQTYTWNARNQLITLSGGVTASFAYDGVGRRRAKTVNGTTTGFFYDGLNAVQELTSGSPSANILAGSDLDEWFIRVDSAGERHFLVDALGSPLALSDNSGVLQTEYVYEPFGRATANGPDSANSSRFTGREEDGTGLHYYRARYYDPSKQRFIAEDPLGFDGGDSNLHTYVFNRPTLLTDRTGLAVMPLPPHCRPRGRKDPPRPPLVSFLLHIACDPVMGSPLGMAGAGGGGRAVAAVGRAAASKGRATAAAAAAKAASSNNPLLQREAQKMMQAVQRLEDLLEQLANAAGKQRGPVQDKIGDIAKEILGHVKEVVDRWKVPPP